MSERTESNGVYPREFRLFVSTPIRGKRHKRYAVEHGGGVMIFKSRSERRDYITNVLMRQGDFDAVDRIAEHVKLCQSLR